MTNQTVDTITAELERLGAPPPSGKHTKQQLTRWLGELRERVRMTISMRRADELAILRMAEDAAPKRQGGRHRDDGSTANLSAFMRTVLAEYAERHGYGDEARVLRDGDQ